LNSTASAGAGRVEQRPNRLLAQDRFGVALHRLVQDFQQGVAIDVAASIDAED